MDSSRSSCTCHWLSSRLSELGDKRGQAERSEECVHVNICVCVSEVGGYSAGALIGMSEKEREREEMGEGRFSVSSS